MDTEAGIWLVALLIAAAFSILRLVAQGLRWRWGRGWFAHLGAVMALGVVGLLVASQARDLAQLCAAIGWILLLAPGLVMMRAARRLQLAVASYDVAGARRALGLMRPFAHLPGYGLAAAQLAALELALAGDHAAAEARLAPYEAADTPPTLRAAARGVRLFVRLHARDWPGIVALAATIAPPPGPASPEIAAPAVRALLELGEVEAAAAWLGRLQLDDAAQVGGVDQAAVPVFSLLGAIDDLEAAFARLGPKAMPEPFRAYWRGRARAALGDHAGARAELERALALVPAGLGEARRRVGDVLATLDAPPPPLDEAARLRALAAARAAILPARGAADLVRGRGGDLVPRVLASIVAVSSLLVLAGLERWVPGWWDQAVRAFEAGALDARAVRRGEWWRLVTHMGLHVHLTHLALNLFALLWLGARATRLFGPVALVAVFLTGGVAGGLVHVGFASRDVAVGASGGVLALLGMLAVGWWRAGDLLPAPVRKRLLGEMAAVIGIQLVFDQFVPQVAAAAHAGGLIAGALLGVLAPLRREDAVDAA